RKKGGKRADGDCSTGLATLHDAGLTPELSRAAKRRRLGRIVRPRRRACRERPLGNLPQAYCEPFLGVPCTPVRMARQVSSPVGRPPATALGTLQGAARRAFRSLGSEPAAQREQALRLAILQVAVQQP